MKITIEIPDGDQCGNCKMRQENYCLFFREMLGRVHEYEKCDTCLMIPDSQEKLTYSPSRQALADALKEACGDK